MERAISQRHSHDRAHAYVDPHSIGRGVELRLMKGKNTESMVLARMSLASRSQERVSQLTKSVSSRTRLVDQPLNPKTSLAKSMAFHPSR